MEIIYGVLEVFLIQLSVVVLNRKKIKIIDIIVYAFIAITMVLLYQYLDLASAVLLYILLFAHNYLVTKEIWSSIFSASLIYVSIIFIEQLTSVITLMLGLSSNFSLSFVVLSLCFVFIPTYILFYYLGNKLTKIVQASSIRIFIGFISLCAYIIFFLKIYIERILKIETNISTDIVNISIFVIIIAILLATVVLYLKSIYLNMKMKQDRIEYESLKMYTNEIEFQFNEVRKFRHDYQNIILSLDNYFEENDFQGLKKYYNESIKNSFNAIIDNNFRLENLSKIKNKELKSIFSIKLIRAQELGIDVLFESIDEINDINVESIYLIRMLGIIFDNAIEELVHLENGLLSTGIIKENDVITIIVENTCRDSINKLHIIKQERFTTKENHSGLGLSILDEIVAKNENLLLETSIENNKFIQKIMIINEV